MEVGEGERIRRRTLAALKPRGDYVTMDYLCEKVEVTWQTITHHLGALIARGYVEKKFTDSRYGYALTHAGVIEYKKVVKKMKSGS